MFIQRRIKTITSKQEQTFNQRLSIVGIVFALLLVHVINPQLGLAIPTLAVSVPLFLYLMARSQSLNKFKLRLIALEGIYSRRVKHSSGVASPRWSAATHHNEIVKTMSESAQNLSRDLDIGGPHSVLAGFDETFTRNGTERLLRRCLEPSLDLGIVKANQSEVQKLSKAPGPVLKYLAFGQSVFNHENAQGAQPLAQLENLDSLLTSPIYKPRFRHVPIILILLWLVTFGLLIATDQNPELSKYTVAFPVVSVLSLGLLNRGFHELVGLSVQLEALLPVVAQAKRLKEVMKDNSIELDSWLLSVRSLSRALSFLSVNSHPLVVILLNLILPWNWIASAWAERNRAKISQKTNTVLNTIYQLEAIGSLALASTRAGYVFPTVTSGDSIHFEDLYHPSQSPKSFIANSFSFPEDKTVVLVTGSNMSGKSTFLRTLGVGQILALSGCAVPCRSFTTGLFMPLTCLRVSDSLRDGASYFYAEVQRLKWILDQLKEGSLSLVLIDEIFRGTNNRERLLGSTAYVKALLKERARSFVTTHDLELTAIENDEKSLTNMHFSDKVSQGKMTFDYKIRPGASPTTNALKIMSMVGLPVEVPT